VVALLVGYAIGTLQVLAVEWVRRVTRHRSDLRVLRAELRRAASYDSRFAIDDVRPADKTTAPRPPRASPRFADFVTQTAFHLTDKFRDGPTQEALLGVLDACAMFQETLDRWHQIAAEFRQATLPEQASLLTDLKGTARDYDRRLDQFLPVVQNLIADIDERLVQATLWRQLNRPLGKLPLVPTPRNAAIAGAT
jgi:hypothetical protein